MWLCHEAVRTYEAALLRRSYREDGKVKNETLGNISSLAPREIEGIRSVLAGRVLVDLDEALSIERSLPHGHFAAGLGVLRGLAVLREERVQAVFKRHRGLGPGV